MFSSKCIIYNGFYLKFTVSSAFLPIPCNQLSNVRRYVPHRRRGERETAVSCWPDAAPFTRFSLPLPSKKVTEFVALIEIPSKRKEKKKRVVPDRSERESKNSKSELDFESELQQARGFLAGCI